ncbi:MAG: efflux RND transporter periplasmic adaptor subunit [Sedimentisphaerales bacterium]|nr:efflux RND transporter periplasmic adaptor subunit [Sedimentisphaerales bacterium]
MRSKILYAITLLILAVLVVVFINSVRRPRVQAEAADEPNRPERSGKALVRLSDQSIAEFGIETAPAGAGSLRVFLSLPGEVTLNADRLVHIVPRVPGVAAEVYRNLGDQVRAGDLLAVIESRELADLKAAYLAAHERVNLAQTSFTREEGLWQRRVSAEREYLDARRGLAEAQIELRVSEQRLQALGFTQQYMAELPGLPRESFTRQEIVAPIDGTIVDKHIVLGQAIRDDRECFVLADLSSVCVNLNVHQNDLARIQTGQEVTISAEPSLQAQGTVGFVSSPVSEPTGTILARVVLANPTGQWRAGLYVTGQVCVEETDVPVLVPRESLVRLEGATVVFLETAEGYRPTPVMTGRSNETQVEVLSGLTPGQAYVTRGASLLKSELEKPTGEE